MKRPLLYISILSVLILSSLSVLAQVPNITYTPNTNALTVGTPFSITPTNSGGAVVAGGYSPIYSFYAVTAPWDVTVDNAGNVYTVSETGNTLIKINPVGTATTLVNGGALNEPTGVAIDGVGNIYVSNFGTNQILKYNTAGTLLATISSTAGVTINQPYGISFDAQNNAYLGNVGGPNIIKIAAGTTTTSIYATGLTTPYGTAVDPSGNLYVSEYTVNNDIIKITPGGVQSVFATGFSAPRQLGSDAAGNVFVADYGNNAVKMITPSGTVTTIAGATGLTTPRSIQTDNVGSFYIADYGNNAIKKLAATGYVISSPLPAGLSFNTTTGAITGTPTVAFASTVYSVIAYNATGKSTVKTVTLSCTQTTADWNGGTTAWATASNWSTGVTPNQFTAVRIGSNATFTNQPTLSASTTVGSVTFGTTKAATLTIANAQALTINTALTVNGAGVPIINGSGTSAGVNMAPGSLVTIGTGSLTINSPVIFTLQSSSAGDASMGQITTTSIKGTGAGNVAVERYLSAKRSYRLLSSPVYAGVVSTNNVYSVNYIINNSFLTGTDGTAGGFDRAGNPTLYLYRESLTTGTNVNFTTGNFRGIKNINQTPAYTYLIDVDAGNFNIPSGNGYLFFFRGSRSTLTPFVANNTNPALATVLSATGTLNAGQFTVKDWFTPTTATLSYTSTSPVAGYTLVGNPYASSINWDLFQTATTTSGIYGTAVNSYIYVLDPITQNYGSYIAGSGGVGSANFVSNIISSGQSFFVVATSTSAKLIFNESAKTTTQNTGTTLLMGTPVNTASNQYLHLQMGQDSVINDQTMIRFNSQAQLVYTNDIDAPYKPGFGAASLATKTSDNVDLSIYTMPLPKLQQENIPLNIGVKSDGAYTIALKDLVAIPKLFDVWLIDHNKNDSLDMRQNKPYGFNIVKADSSTFGAKRFSLIIRQNPAYAYRLLAFNATKIPNTRQSQVMWTSENEENYTNFTVMRKTDKDTAYTVLSDAIANGQGTYSVVDANPANGLNLYKLKQEDINNVITFSKPIGLQYSGLSGSALTNTVAIFPNPATSILNLAVPAQSTGTVSYNIKFMTSSGLVIKEITSDQATWQGNVSNLQPGTYLIRVTNNKTQTLVGENKFVKL